MTPADATDEPDIAADVSDLAAVYLGAYRLADLVSAGRVTERRPGSARVADALFAVDRAPMCVTPF